MNNEWESFSPVLVGCSRHVSQCRPGQQMGDVRTVRWYELELITAADRGGVLVDGHFEPALPGRLYIRKPGMKVVGVHAYDCLSLVFDICWDEHMLSGYAQHHFASSTPEEQAWLRSRKQRFSFLDQLPSWLDTKNPVLFSQLFQQCLDWQIRGGDQAFFHQRALLYHILAALLEEAQSPSVGDSPTAAAVTAVRDWIDTYYARPVTLKMLSEHAGLSREYLCRLFHRRYGLPPIEYLIGVRLMHARQLLTHTDDPVEHIAAQCGFENLGHFYHCFKKHEGQTPARYRSQNRYPYSLQNG